MDISTTPKHKDDMRHAPVPQTEEEHDTEIIVFVTPLSSTLKSILNSSPLTEIPVTPGTPSHNKRDPEAMTASPTSPDSPEHKYSHHKTPENNNKAGDHPEANSPTTIPRTRRIKRALTANSTKWCHQTTQNSSNTDSQTQHNEIHRQDQDADWLYTNQQLNEIAITNAITSEQCIPIFSAINLKTKRKMLFAPMDFNNLSMDALKDSGALVNSLPESEFKKKTNQSAQIKSRRDGPNNVQTTSRKWQHRSTHQDCPTPV